MHSASEPGLLRNQKERFAPAFKNRALSVPVASRVSQSSLQVWSPERSFQFRNLPCNPIHFRECLNYIADQLRLAEVASVPTDDNQPPQFRSVAQ